MNGCSQFVVSPLIFVLMNRTKQTSKPTSKQSAHKKASIDETFAQLLPNLLPVTVDAVLAKVAPDDALLNLPEAQPSPATLPHGEKTAASGRIRCQRSPVGSGSSFPISRKPFSNRFDVVVNVRLSMSAFRPDDG